MEGRIKKMMMKTDIIDFIFDVSNLFLSLDN
jgi:hypothetical protein